MKIECTRKDFAEALALAGSATSVRTALPILQTVLLEAKESALRILGADGDMWAERRIIAHVEEDGSACVQYGLLNQIVSALPDGQIQFDHEGTTLTLRQGKSEWKLLALPSDDFPEPAVVSGTAHLSLSMGELRESVDGVSYAVADDNSRPVLTGVLFTYDGNILTLVATDTKRLAVVRLDKEGLGSQVTAIVPEKALKAIRSMPISDDETVTVKFDENQLGVDSGTAMVVSQLLAGSYPNWQRVVPEDFTRSWTVDRSELIDNVKRAMILARDNANRVRFSGSGDAVTISSRSEDKGEAKELVPVVSKNGDIEIAFNGKYVLDALQSLKGDGIRAELTEPARPALFYSVEKEKSQYCVIMPMALG
ncbi:MAG: DNA polymerase III subunit beta [Armatimonadetes bacterium]|nr:DNA polymerase III subunit beta [Armatimonadota bacterium]